VPEPLGAGAQGTVWRAFDASLGRDVAIKTARGSDPGTLALLKREFRLLQDLHHPGLVVPLEVLADGERVFVVLPLVDGVPLDRWVDEATAEARWARLRGPLAGLLDAVAALHGAGLCHGDLKPDNALVTPDGALHLLDFGLARDTDQPGAGPGAWGGTFAYLAPEVMAGGSMSIAADLYAIGVVIHEAVLGVAPDPFSASPAAGADRAPAEAGRIIRALMQVRPAERTPAAELLRTLAGGSPRAAAATASFVGRAAELDALGAAADAARSGARPAVVRIQGPSGIGKSGLLRELARRLAGTWTVCWGRAHALDHVPYNALDDLLHDVALRDDGPVVADVAAVFPPFQGRSVEGAPAAQPEDRRRRAFAGVATALSRLAQRGPLLLIIDDVHWADAPSEELLAAICDQAVGPILVVLSHRPDAEASVVRRLDRWAADGRLALALDVGQLAPDDAGALWRALAGDGAPPPRGDDGGHPLFLQTLAHADGSSGDIEALTRVGFGALDDAARRVVAAVALSPEPIPRAELRAVAGLDADGLIVDLSRSRWLALVGAGGDRVESAHHRIGEAVGSSVADPAPVHRALFAARSAGGVAAPAVLWLHARRGELREEAALQAWTAGERAEAALAFGQAVDWYLRAEEDGGAGRSAAAVHERVAAALVLAGRGGESIARYRRAADEGPPGDALRLRGAAAEQAVRAGHTEDGLRAFSALLGEIGEVMPTEDRFASREATGRRLKSLLWGWRPAQVRDLSGSDVVDLEVVRQAMTAFSGIAPQLTDCLGLRVMDRARALGSRRHLVLSLGQEACLEAFVGGWPFDRRADEMLAWAVDQAGADPYLRAFVDQCRNVVCFGRGQFRGSFDAGTSAVAQLRQACPGTAWEVSVIQSYAHHAQWWLGDLEALRDDVNRSLEDALRRGDGFGANTHRLGEPALALLMDDDHEAVLARAADAEASWPDLPFHVYRYLHALTLVGVRLYRQEAELAWAGLEAAWPNLAKGNLLVLGVLAMHLWTARARVAIATARVAEARAAVRALRRLRLPQAQPLAALLDACLHRDGAGALRAGDQLDAIGAPLWAAAARWRGGQGAAGLAARGVVAPERIAAMLAPAPPDGVVVPRRWW
jgi:hypothetical protein